MVPIRQSAEVRRASVLNAAIVEFARSGYAGTSTEAIAARAGISQPYLFRLFGTKKELFIATYSMVASRIEEAFMAVTRELEGEEAMIAMGMAYLELLADPDLLQVQLHGFVAAAADPDIASACQDTFRRLWRLVDAATHAEPAVIREFFAQGMLCNVLAAIDLRSVEEPWAQSFFDEEEAKQEAMLTWGGTRPDATPQTRTGSA
ncbi:MAG: TetR/AcrR family transcriptional regulator [Acidimicrobiales bacterium]